MALHQDKWIPSEATTPLGDPIGVVTSWIWALLGPFNRNSKQFCLLQFSAEFSAIYKK